MLLNEEVPAVLLEHARGEEATASGERDSFKGWEQECSSAPQGH